MRKLIALRGNTPAAGPRIQLTTWTSPTRPIVKRLEYDPSQRGVGFTPSMVEEKC